MSGELRVMSGEGRGESKQPRSGPFTATANSPLTPHPSPLTPYSSPLAPRRGFSLLELQVAFVLFGIALAGLGPLVVMQSRQLQRLEARFNDQTTYYLVPSTHAWARKLGAAASLQAAGPGPPASPPVTLIDNGDLGYSEPDVGGVDWAGEYRANAFGGSHRWNNPETGDDKAHWEFTGIEAGWYQVLVTFAEAEDQATSAPYTVYDGAVAKGTVTVNQTIAPSGAVFEGSAWESLGLFSITGDTLQVELSDLADHKIVADAVRVVPVRNTVEVLSLAKSLASEEVTAQVSVTLQVP